MCEVACLQFKQSRATIIRDLSARNAIQSDATCVGPIKALDAALSSHQSQPSLLLIRSNKYGTTVVPLGKGCYWCVWVCRMLLLLLWLGGRG
jgi:hypothetical protein